MKKSFAILLCLLFVSGCGSSKDAPTNLTTPEPEKVTEATESVENISDEEALLAALEGYYFHVDGMYIDTSFRDDGTTSEMDIDQEFNGELRDVEISEIVQGSGMDGANQVFFSSRVANDFFQTTERENFSASYKIGELVTFYEDFGLLDPEKQLLCEPTIPFDFSLMEKYNRTYEAAKENSKGNFTNYPNDMPTYVEFTMDDVENIEVVNYAYDSVFSKKPTVLFTLNNGWIVKNTLYIDYDPAEHEENYTSDEKSYEDYELWWIGSAGEHWLFQTLKE